MKSQKKYNILAYLFSLILILFGCASDYEEIDGELYYVNPTANGKIKTKLHDVDKSSFETIKDNDFLTISKRYAKDKKNVYYKGRLIEGASAKSFKLIDHAYAVDEHSVFYQYKKLEADLNSFEYIGKYFARDKNHVFAQGKIQDKITDPASFELVKHEWTRDKNYYYVNNFRIVEADYNSFKILTADYAVDKNHVFYRYFFNKVGIVEGADPKTFRIITKYRNRGKDKNGCYFEGKLIDCKDVL